MSVTVDPSGKYAYVANSANGLFGGNSISQYTIGATGALTPMSPAAVPDYPLGTYLVSDPVCVTVDPSGKYAYVANQNNYTVASVSQFKIGANGALTFMSPDAVAGGKGPHSVAVDPSGKYAYLANADDIVVSQYTIGANGALTPMTPATVALFPGTQPASVTVDPSGKYAYVADLNGFVSQFTIGADGALTPMTPATVPAGVEPVSIITVGSYE
jgi:DNA-binding beta-propeller fold protein YncE